MSTMVRADELVDVLRDSRARLLAVSPEYAAVATAAVGDAPELTGVLAAPARRSPRTYRCTRLDAIAATPLDEAVYRQPLTHRRSGSTPRAPPASRRAPCTATASIQVVCETYAQPGARHPPRRPLPVRGQGIFRLRARQFVAVPALGRRRGDPRTGTRPRRISWSSGRKRTAPRCSSPARRSSRTCCGPAVPADALGSVRLAASAGEPLPAALYQRWTAHFGVDIVDGIGMTEMLHIFLSNRPGEVRPGHHRRRGARLRPAHRRRVRP